MPDSDSASSTAYKGLSPGDRLGPYEIRGLLGVGGMGEVYRAHDPRLGRDVALKILRRSGGDPDQVARFSREARAAGSLNHPNIVAVFDVGTEEGVPFVVTELLEGETLRDRLDRGPLAYRKALDYGIQIAQALDAAHAKGIWHRDVKPANVFVGADGRVKLLDFGIAKLSERDAWTASHETTIETSRAGEIRGTAGYMSPEQVLGEPVDHRADIFALGAVLYEMFTGGRAFRRPSAVETMTAVLQAEPPDPLTVNPNLAPAAAAIVRRCLEKNREERFQSARDLAFNLQQLREPTGLVRPLPDSRSSRRRRLLIAGLGGALLLSAGALALVLRDRDPAPTFEQLTFRRSRIGGARFASDGQAVVFSEARTGNALEIWRIDLPDSPASRLLGYSADLLAVRPGELALSLRRRFVLGERFVGTLAFASIGGGGSPREVAENIEDADWDPSGTNLAVAHSTGGAGGQSVIEYPHGTPLYRTVGSVRFLRVSRDGQRIAFVEDPNGRGIGGRVAVVDLKGTVKTLTREWPSVRGVAWSAQGNEVWFSAGESGTNRALHAVTLDGKERAVLQAPGSLTLWDIASDGRLLLARDDERRAVVGVPPGESAERDYSWFDASGVAALSADGHWLLTGDRFGVYLRRTDGSPPTDLGFRNSFADDLSPDGKTVLATNAERQLVLIPTGPGEPRLLPTHGIVRYNGAWWFPDGQHVLFNGSEAGHALRSYIQKINGDPPRPLTPENTRAVAISPDGAWAAAISEGQPMSLYPVAGGAPRPVPGSQAGDRPVAWTEDGRKIWTFRREVPAQVLQLDIATGRRQLWKTLTPADTAGVYSIIGFQITPSGHSYFYDYTQLLSQLYLVWGLE